MPSLTSPQKPRCFEFIVVRIQRQQWQEAWRKSDEFPVVKNVDVFQQQFIVFPAKEMEEYSLK